MIITNNKETEADFSLRYGFTVIRTSTNINTANYLINEQPISFGLTGHAEMQFADHVADCIHALDVAMSDNNLDDFKQVVGFTGGKNALNILQCLFAERATTFLKQAAFSSAKAGRERFFPAHFLKSIFHRPVHLFFDTLLAAFEEEMPAHIEYLESSSFDEIASSKDQWILYYREGTSLHQIIADFCGNDAIREEWRCFLRESIQHLPKEPAIVMPALTEVHKQIDKAVRASYEAGRPIDSIESIAERIYTSRNSITVCRASIDNNQIHYIINECAVSFCISVQPAVRSSDYVADCVCAFNAALSTNDMDGFKRAVSMVGAKGALNILQALFSDRTLRFVKQHSESVVHESRQIFFPAKFMKSIFGSPQHPFYKVLLAALEEGLPEFARYLEAGNFDEIASCKDEWVLYYRKRNALRWVSICFAGSETLKEETRCYLRECIKQKPHDPERIALATDRSYGYIAVGINTLDELGRTINSIKELTNDDIRTISSAMLNQNKYTPNSVRGTLYTLDRFRKFTFGIGSKEFDELMLPRGVIPQPSKNLTDPFPKELLDFAKEHEMELPPHIRMALKVCCATLSRADSIFDLTTNDLVLCADGTYQLRVFNGKAALPRSASGMPTRSIHECPAWLAMELLDYIKNTADLRSQLDTPYIFVYSPSERREGSLRKPMVLNAESFRFAMRAFFERNEVYSEDGLVNHCGMRNIRAEGGRALYANGKSSSEVAAKLGNTPKIAADHYNKEYPEDMAKRLRGCFENTTDKAFLPAVPGETFPVHNTPMFGDCASRSVCPNNNNCLTCGLYTTTDEGGNPLCKKTR